MDRGKVLVVGVRDPGAGIDCSETLEVKSTFSSSPNTYDMFLTWLVMLSSCCTICCWVSSIALTFSSIEPKWLVPAKNNVHSTPNIYSIQFMIDPVYMYMCVINPINLLY